jgi:hypothetical protein
MNSGSVHEDQGITEDPFLFPVQLKIEENNCAGYQGLQGTGTLFGAVAKISLRISDA